MIRFTKMHGLGNDFVCVNGHEEQVRDPAALSRAVSDRHFGVGSDGLVLILLMHQMPFRFVDRDADDLLEGLDVLIVPDIKLVSRAQMARVETFLQRGKALLTGLACRYDAYYLPRERDAYARFFENPNILRLEDSPEKATQADLAQAEDSGAAGTPVPEGADAVVAALQQLGPAPVIRVEGSRFIGVDTFSNDRGEHFVHVLNYDNTLPADLAITLEGAPEVVSALAPEGLGPVAEPEIELSDGRARIEVKRLHTYMVVRYGNA